MKKVALLAIFIFAGSGLFAQQTIKSDTVNPFGTISLSGNLNVQLIAAESNKVEIVLSDDADMTKFKWGVSNEVLTFSLRATQGKGRADVKIYYANALKSISISGGELMTNEPIVADMLKISASGGTKITVGIEVVDAELEVTGNSSAQFSGSTKYMSLRATDKSKVDTRQLECISAEVETTVNAEVYISVTERLIANAKTGSTIFYKGTPLVLKNLTSKMNSGMMGSSVHNIGE